MRKIWWKEWTLNFPGGDLICHPVIIAVARSLSLNPRFMRWMGHVHPVIMPLEPIAMITVAALCRIRVRYGYWDTAPIEIKIRPERFDEEIGVPGLFDALWAGELIERVTADGFVLRPKPGSFPKNYEGHFAKKEKAEQEAALSSLRKSVLCGMASPRPGPTPEA